VSCGALVLKAAVALLLVRAWSLVVVLVEVLVEVIVGSSILLNDMAEMEGKGLGLGISFDERMTEVGVGDKAVEEMNVGIMNGVEDTDEVRSVVSDPD